MQPAFQREGQSDDHRHRNRNDERMPEREEQSDRNRPLAFLHQLAHDIVDGRNVVGIDGVAQSEHISEKCGAKERRPPGEGNDRPGPHRRVGGEQQTIDRYDFRTLIGRCVIDRAFRKLSTKYPRMPGVGASEDQKTYRLSDHPRIHPDPRLSRRHGRWQVSWLADRRLVLPSRRLHYAASGLTGRDFPLTVAGAAADLAGAYALRRTAFPIHPHDEGPSIR